MGEQKDKNILESILKAGDSWLMRYGVVSPLMHNNIILNLYSNFPKVKYLEYFLDSDNRKIEVILYIPFWTLLFLNKEKFIDTVEEFLKEYLNDYHITIRLKTLKKGNKREIS